MTDPFAEKRAAAMRDLEARQSWMRRLNRSLTLEPEDFRGSQPQPRPPCRVFDLGVDVWKHEPVALGELKEKTT